MQDITCSVCGDRIADNHDVEYDLDAAGNVSNVRHTDAYHRDLAA